MMDRCLSRLFLSGRKERIATEVRENARDIPRQARSGKVGGQNRVDEFVAITADQEVEEAMFVIVTMSMG